MPTLCCQLIAVFSGVACCICCFGARASGARASLSYLPRPNQTQQVEIPNVMHMFDAERVQEPVEVPTDELSDVIV